MIVPAQAVKNVQHTRNTCCFAVLPAAASSLTSRRTRARPATHDRHCSNTDTAAAATLAHTPQRGCAVS